MIQCHFNIRVVSYIQLLVNKNVFNLQFFDLIANKSEIYKIPKWTQFWHENAQNRFGFYKARRREMNSRMSVAYNQMMDCCPPSQNFGGDSPSLSPHDLRHCARLLIRIRVLTKLSK